MSLKFLLFIAVGGALGAVGRYSVTTMVTQWVDSSFPYGTMIVNILGSLVLGGLLSALALNWAPSTELRSFIQVGVLGAFTTFSAFSMDAYEQIARGHILEAALYIGGSVVIGIMALMAGVALGRQVFA